MKEVPKIRLVRQDIALLISAGFWLTLADVEQLFYAHGLNYYPNFTQIRNFQRFKRETGTELVRSFAPGKRLIISDERYPKPAHDRALTDEHTMHKNPAGTVNLVELLESVREEENPD